MTPTASFCPATSWLRFGGRAVTAPLAWLLDTTGETPAPATVADAVWRRAPTALCLVVDDVHWLTPGSPGSTWLTALVDALPANGHVLLASRWSPAVPLARLATHGAALRLDEDDLRFTDDELAGFAARRGIAIGRFDDTGGWPAMAELAASVGHGLAGEYLWQEVLEPLGPERRQALAMLSDLGGADDGLASAALGTPVDLARVLDGVPLVAHGADGWRVPHPLWQGVPALTLADDDRVAARRRAVDHLVAEHRYDEAMTLAREVGLVDAVPGILRAACIGPNRPPGRQLERWLADLPEAVRVTAGAALAAGVKAALLAPADATDPLQTAIRRCREAGDPIGELGAIALLGQVAWWRADLELLAGLFPRVVELEAEGHPLARALAALGQAVVADMTGGDDDVLANLDAIEPGALDDAWEAMAGWLRGTTLAGGGRPAESIAVFDAIPPIPDPAFQLNLEGARLEALWALGEIDEVVAAAPSITDGLQAAGVLQFALVSLAETAFVFAWVGDVEGAQSLVERVQRTGVGADVGQSARLALAEAAILVAADDEPAAADVLEHAIALHGLDSGVDRRVWRRGLALTYVLVPSARRRWEAAELRGHVAEARTLARAVVTLREGAGCAGGRARDADGLRRSLRDLDLSDVSRVRSGLPHRFAVELALGLEAAGRPEGAALLEALGPRGRQEIRAEAATRTHRAKLAQSLLAAVPAPPPDRTEIAVLGRLAVARNGEPVTDGDLRRERVRALLAFLVGHRRTSRAAITAALWPDLDERAAANNLRVTMTYLLRVLEPWRSAASPPITSGSTARPSRSSPATGCGSTSTASTSTSTAPRAPRPTAHRRWRSSTTWPPSASTAVRLTRATRTATGSCSSASTSGAASWPPRPGRASCWPPGETWTRPNAWPGVPSRPTRGPRTPTPYWSRWRWPEATVRPPAAPSTGRWTPSPTSTSSRPRRRNASAAASAARRDSLTPYARHRSRADGAVRAAYAWEFGGRPPAQQLGSPATLTTVSQDGVPIRCRTRRSLPGVSLRTWCSPGSRRLASPPGTNR